MKAGELIEILKLVPPDTEVFVWHDDRYSIYADDPIDASWLEEHKFVDINLGRT